MAFHMASSSQYMQFITLILHSHVSYLVCLQAVFGDMNPMMITLYERFHVSCAVLIVRGKVWVRLSAFVYNTMADYDKLRDAVLVLKMESLAA